MTVNSSVHGFSILLMFFYLIRSLKTYNYNMRRISIVVKSYNLILQLLIYYFTGKYFLPDHLP